MTSRRLLERCRGAAVVMVLVLGAAACASNLSEEEKIAANGTFIQPTAQQAVAAGTATRLAGGSSPRSGADTGSVPGDASPGAGAAGAAAGSSAGAEDISSLETSGPTCAAPGTSEIVLGTFGTEGGVIGANVVTAPVGIRAWVADINARGGLCGHPVRVVFGGNDNGDPATAISIARRLVEQDKVIALLSPYSPTGMPPVYDFLEERGVPVIADSSQVPRADVSPMSFMPNVSSAGNAFGFVAAFVTQTDARRVAILYLREVASARGNVDSVLANEGQFGYEVVYEAAVSLAQPDFTAEMTAARSAGADVVIGVVDFTTMTKVIRAAWRQDYRPQFSGSLAFVTDAVSQASEEFEGVVAYSPTASYRAAQLADYREAVAAYVPRGEMGLLGPVAWGGGKLLERIAPFLPEEPTSADLVEVMYTVQNESLGGLVPTFSFVRTGAAPYVNLCVQPVRFTSGQWTQPRGDDYFECRP